MSEVRNINGGKLIGLKTSTFTVFNQEKYDPKVIPTVWENFFKQYRASDLPQSKIFYSAIFPSQSMDVPMDYFAGVLVDKNIPTPEGFTECEVPTGNYFCVTHNGPISNLNETFGKAYGVEFPAAQKEMRNAPHLEIYDSEKDPMDPSYSMVLGIPIK